MNENISQANKEKCLKHEIHYCPSCGAGLVFNPKTQKLICHYCDNEYGLKDIQQIKLQVSKEEIIENIDYSF